MARTGAFDIHTEEYEDWFKRNSFAYLSEIELLKSLLPGGRGLEIGVGSGLFAEPLGIEFGVDPSLSMAALAKERNISVAAGTAEELPVGSITFDFALMVTSICFVDDPLASLREAHRAVIPGGKLLLGFVDRQSPLGEEYLEKKDSSLFYPEAVFYSTSELMDYCREAQWRPLSVRETLREHPSRLSKEEGWYDGHGAGGFTAILCEKEG
jgi:SAM-dependent methyltransferase